MNRKNRIESIVTQALAPRYLELIDESNKHVGHSGSAPGGETHYRLIISSNQLNELNRVKAHQIIYGLLADEFKTGLHALSIELVKPAP